MSDLLHLWLAQQKTKTAVAETNYARASVDLCQIRERLAEMKSQHEPLHSKSGEDRDIRRLMYNAAFYAVVGRWPREEDVS